MKLCSRNAVVSFVLWSIVVTQLIGADSTPYHGAPPALPGTVQAEDFDAGVEGDAYHDLSTANEGGQYRATGVDIETSGDTGGGYNIGWLTAGEWMNYTVSVASAGTYDIEARVASSGPGGTFHIEVNGVNLTGPFSIPDTGGWQRWVTVRKTGLALSAGQQVWRIVADTNGPLGGIGNVNHFTVRTSAAPPPAAARDIVLYSSDFAPLTGNWTRVVAGDAAGGEQADSHDYGWANLNQPAASPAHYFEARFVPEANRSYRTWLRLRATGHSKANDSVWVQFSGAVDTTGNPLWQTGSSSALLVNLEACSGCGTQNWGWSRGAWWLAHDGIVRFTSAGEQIVRVQTREDGVAIDQIVLSPVTYFDAAPGPATNDATIVPKPDGGGTANQLPAVAITAPANGATYTVPAAVAIEASATDSDGTVTRVDFFAGSQLISTDTAAPWNTTWNSAPQGTHSLTAVAFDNGGGTRTSAAVSVTVNAPPNQVPTVSITSPATGATYTAPATIAVSASAADSDGTIAQVDFFAGTQPIGSDTSAPYTVSWSNVAAGTYSLTAVARDNTGATTTSAAVSVTVNAPPNQVPTVSITSPATGATFTAPATIAVSASAADTDGTIAQVDFFAGTQPIGSDTSAPYTVSWSNVAAGTYSLTAVARDNTGATTTSAAVSITVTTAPGPSATIVAFNPSLDHADAVTTYLVWIYRAEDPSQAQPVASRDIGKPQPSNNEIRVDISSLVDPLPAGSYYAVVIARSASGSGASDPSAAFTK